MKTAMASIVAVLVSAFFVGTLTAQPMKDMRKDLWSESFVDSLIKDPKKMVFIAEADRDPKQAERMRTADKYGIDVPRRIADENYGNGLGVIYELYKTFAKSPRELWREKVREYYYTDPKAFYSLANRAYEVLTKKSEDLTDRERDYRKLLENEVKDGIILSPQSSLRRLISSAPAGAVGSVLYEKLKSKSDEDISRIFGTQEELRKFLKDELGSVDEAVTAISTKIVVQSKQIDALTDDILKLVNEAERRAVEEQRAALIAEQRAGIFIASRLIGLVDSEAGRIIDVGGNAAVDVAIAMGKIGETGLSLATTGNIIGAAFAVVSLFDKSPDAATIRHQQLVGMLSRIGEQLREIASKLTVIDQKINEVLTGIDQLKLGQTEIIATIAKELAELDERVGSVFIALRNDHVAILSKEFYDERLACHNLFPRNGPYVNDSLSVSGLRLGECLSIFEAHGFITAALPAFTFSDFNLIVSKLQDLQDLRKLPNVTDHIGIYLQAATIIDLEKKNNQLTIKGAKLTDFSGLHHPLALAEGIEAFLEFRQRRPELKYDNEMAIVSSLSKASESILRVIDIAHAASREPADPLVSAPYFEAIDNLHSVLQSFEELYLQDMEAQNKVRQVNHHDMRWECWIAGYNEESECSRTRPKILLRSSSFVPNRHDINIIMAYFGGLMFLHRAPIAGSEATYPFPRLFRSTAYDSNPEGLVIASENLCTWYEPKLVFPSVKGVEWLEPLPVKKWPEATFYFFHKAKHCGQVVSDPSPNAQDANISLMNKLHAQTRQLLVKEFGPITDKPFFPRGKDPIDKWKPPADQEWNNPAYALDLAKPLLTAHQKGFATWLHERFEKKELPLLGDALDRLDRAQFVWEIFERLGFGNCFYTVPAKTDLFYNSGLLVGSNDIVRLLAEKKLVEVFDKLENIRTKKTTIIIEGQSVEIPLLKAARIQSYDKSICSRYPSALVRALAKLDAHAAYLSRKAFRSSADSVNLLDFNVHLDGVGAR